MPPSTTDLVRARLAHLLNTPVGRLHGAEARDYGTHVDYFVGGRHYRITVAPVDAGDDPAAPASILPLVMHGPVTVHVGHNTTPSGEWVCDDNCPHTDHEGHPR